MLWKSECVSRMCVCVCLPACVCVGVCEKSGADALHPSMVAGLEAVGLWRSSEASVGTVSVPVA